MGTFLERDFPKLIDIVFDAALDPSRWQQFINTVSDAFGGANGILYCFNREHTPTTDFVCNGGSDASFTVSDIQNYLRLSPYPPATYPREAVGTVNLAGASARTEGLHRNGRLNGWEPPQGVPANRFDVPLRSSDGRVVVLAVAPETASLRRHQEAYKRQLELLSPHFVRAIELAHLAEEARLAEPPMRSMLEAFRASAIVLDARDRIVATNRLADHLLCAGRVFALDRFGELSAAAPAQAGRLKAAIAAMRNTKHGGASAPLRIASAADGRGHLVWVVPLSATSSGAQGRNEDPRLRFFGVEGTGAKVLLLACDLHEATGLSHEALMAGFSLSRAEARLSAALVAGRSLSDYAREAGVSRNTVRNQLAIIFEKTGTRRQAELVAHIVGTLWTGNGH
jgi:DNA-binding CsgD family transcriptional regulator